MSVDGETDTATEAATKTAVAGTKKNAAAAIIVPVYREYLTPDEEISRRHLEHFLGRHDRYLVAPERLRLTLPGFGVKRFPDEFFHDTATYSALLLSKEFYEAFDAYTHVLIYQLDALVFSDRLSEWCATDVDYVGAPWLTSDEGGVDFVQEPAVGNGGFSLRRVESFLRVTRAPGFGAELEKYADALAAAAPLRRRVAGLPRKIMRRLRLFSRGRPAILGGRQQGGPPADPGERLNEDCFWSFRAKSYDPAFTVASVAEGLRFSFEVNPRRCYELNGRRLPFGCHAWDKYDREFWEPFLLK